MQWENNLSFFLDVIRQMRLPVQIAAADQDLLYQSDQGLRRQLGCTEEAFGNWSHRLRNATKRNVIFRVTDEFFCKYVVFSLGQTSDERNILLIGPYVTEEIDRVWLEQFCQRTGIHREWLPVLGNYFQNVVFLQDEAPLFALITALGNRLWGANQFVTESVVAGAPETWLPLASIPEQRQPTDVVDDFRMIEARYSAENQLIDAVSQGQTRRAELMLANASRANLEQRTPEVIRNAKNYTVVLNTLLRKAAEQGGVHPLYIDRLSSEFARRIERLTRRDNLSAFWQEMAHRYCLLVKKHSEKTYSPLIQKVIARVEFDLAGDLSLKANAKALNVNASYLSTLFKKELQTTLTEYVSGKRIEYAAFLLNTTKLPISVVGQRCGIQDDNYFTKIFKKYVGKTPKQFRQESSPYPQKRPQGERAAELPQDGLVPQRANQRGVSSLGE